MAADAGGDAADDHHGTDDHNDDEYSNHADAPDDALG